jgi:hypothetical protein
VVYVGDISRLELSLAGGLTITVKQQNRRDLFRPVAGQTVYLGWAREDALLLARPSSSREPIPEKELAHV